MIELNLTRFDLGKIENVVDDGHQVFSGMRKYSQVFTLFRIQRRAGEKIAHRYDGV